MRSGRRQSHSFAAASRMRNTYIAAGPHSPEQLIASVDRGLYCKSMGGGSVGPTGQFNFAVEEGYLIEPALCPDCDRECKANPDGTHTCWDCGISW